MEKERIKHFREEAQLILDGERDNYDGADGARIITDLCDALLEHSPLKGEDGLVEYPTTAYGENTFSSARQAWDAATKAQHRVDLKAQEEAIGKAFASRPLSITVESANLEKAEAVKAERELWWTTIDNEIKMEGARIPAKVIMSVIDRLREGKP